MILFAYTLLLAYLSNEQASCEILRLSCETYANFSIVSHNKRVNHTFRTIPGTDRQTCQLECSQNAKCKSINVKNVDHSCELNNKSFHDPKDRAVTLESSGWVIYSPSYKERLVGVNCRKFEPCPKEKKCLDTCQCPGYKCIDHEEVYSTCTEAFVMNEKKEGSYRVQHQNMAEFVVAECKIIRNKLTAVFHHDSEMLRYVKGYEKPGSYRKNITYDSALENLKRFVDTSVSCHQFTRIDCHGMVLFAIKGTQYAFLSDRDNIRMTYFGGNDRYSRGCRCGLTRTCKNYGSICNCDTNDYIWRSDSGYVTDKQRLPLAAISLGDTGDGPEAGKFFIGPLECIEDED